MFPSGAVFFVPWRYRHGHDWPNNGGQYNGPIRAVLDNDRRFLPGHAQERCEDASVVEETLSLRRVARPLRADIGATMPMLRGE